MIPNHRPDVDEFLLNLQNVSDYREASWKTAQLDRRKHKVNRNGKDFSVMASAQEFEKYGLVVVFFFKFMRLAAWLLLVLFLLQLPVMFSNYNGHGMQSYPTLELSMMSRIMKFALANQPDLHTTLLEPYEKQYPQSVHNRRLQVLVDALCILVGMGFVVYWQCSCHTKMAAAGNSTPPSSYTIFVKNLPAGCTQQSVTEHFNQFATVRQVSLVMNISRLQPAIEQLGSLLDKYRSRLKLYGVSHELTEQSYDKLTVHYWFIRKLVIQAKHQPRTMAFVSFDTVRSRDYVAGLHGFGVGQEGILQIAGGSQVPKVKKCLAEPHNLVWQNISVPNSVRVKQSLIMSLLFALVLFVGLVALFLIKINSGLDFEVDQKHHYSYAEVLERREQSVTDNFCYRLNYRSLSLEYYHLCKQFVQRYGAHLFSTLQYSCVVVLINYLMNLIVISLGGLNRYSTRSQSSRTLMLNMFVVLLLNTALLPLLVQWETNNFSVKDLVVELFGLKEERVHIKTYSNFIRRWYLDVGVQIVMTYVVSFLVCPILLPLTDKALAMWRNRTAKRKRLQKEMNMALRNPQFDFNYYVAQMLAIWFFSWMYASAMPFLYLIGALSMFASEIQSRIVFVRWSQAPTTIDHSLNETIIRILPISMLVHLLMGMQFLSVVEIMPRLVDEQLTIIVQWLLLVLIVFYLIFKKEFNFGILKLIRGVTSLCRRNSDNSTIIFELEERPFDEAMKQGGTSPLISYRMEDNPNYHNLLYTMLVVESLNKSATTTEQNSQSEPERSNSTGDIHEKPPAYIQKIPTPPPNMESERPLVPPQSNSVH